MEVYTCWCQAPRRHGELVGYDTSYTMLRLVNRTRRLSIMNGVFRKNVAHIHREIKLCRQLSFSTPRCYVRRYVGQWNLRLRLRNRRNPCFFPWGCFAAVDGHEKQHTIKTYEVVGANLAKFDFAGPANMKQERTEITQHLREAGKWFAIGYRPNY